MSASADLQKAVEELLASAGTLPEAVPVLRRRDKTMDGAIDEAAAKRGGLFVSIPPPLPLRAMQGNPRVFFESAELRVRIIEIPKLNPRPVDAYDLIDAIAIALHWRPRSGETGNPLAAILSHPLQLASRPVEIVADLPGEGRVFDVIFEAIYGFQPAT